MKNIYHKLYFHPLLYIVAMVMILTGNMKVFTEFMIIILFHELGHILAAIIFKWNINRVIILPLGCMTEFREELNRPIYQELIILLMGPLFQIILNIFFKSNYNYPLLIFNLLPIYPLDGSKFIFLFWNIIGSYYYSYIVTFIISYISIFIINIYYHNLIILLFSIYLLTTSITIYKDRYNYFYKFLYERSNKEYPYYCSIIIYNQSIKKMKRSVKHYFFINNNLISERIFLKTRLNLTRLNI